MKITLTVILIFLVSMSIANADYSISWHTIDGGGGTSSGETYTLTGTIGQPDAASSSGDEYELLGGFWAGGELCFVNFEDFARFSEYWLFSGLDLPADLYPDGTVNGDDLSELAYWWLSRCPYDWPLK